MRRRLRISRAVDMSHAERAIRQNIKAAKQRWVGLPLAAIRTLRELTKDNQLSVALGDLLYLDQRWYVTHAGLLRVARRRQCVGIHVLPISTFCDLASKHWAFKATVYKSSRCHGFVGYGDADPSNVSPLVRGAEMRVAETRAVNRALRKAYGIGLCSVEEIGSFAAPSASSCESRKLPQPANSNGNYGGRTLRDRLCQLIRQHQLNATLVKSYATEFCGVRTLREATREQVQNFVSHLADWAQKDRNALLCQLNSYLPQKENERRKDEREKNERQKEAGVA